MVNMIRLAVVLITALITLRSIQSSFLRQPLPSNIKIGHIPPDKLPKPLSFTYDTTNTHLRTAKKLYQGKFVGAESVAIDNQQGTQYILDRYGYLYTASPILQKIAYVGPGRPLGYHYDSKRHALIICDSLKGLTLFDLSSLQLSILSNSVSLDSPIDPGALVSYANDLDIDEESGDVYFTDSTPIPPALNRGGFYDTMQSYLYTYLGGVFGGRLLKYNNKNGTTHALVNNIYFANGVALSKDKSFVLIVETSSARVLRHWLSGPRQHTTEIFIDGLPGSPDGITRSTTGNSFWLAIILPSSPLQSVVQKSPPAVRWILSWMIKIVPANVLFPRSMGMVIELSEQGDVMRVLQDPDGRHVSGVSGVVEWSDGQGKRLLYMGHLIGDYVSVVDV